MTLTMNLSLGELGEAMAPRSAESFPGKTDQERKHTKLRDTVPGLSGKIYSKNFCNRRKVSSQSGVGGGVRGAQEGAPRGQEGGHARRSPRPPGAPLRLHLGLEFS